MGFHLLCKRPNESRRAVISSTFTFQLFPLKYFNSQLNPQLKEKVAYMLDHGCDLLDTFGGKLARILFYLLLCVIQMNDVSAIIAVNKITYRSKLIGFLRFCLLGYSG